MSFARLPILLLALVLLVPASVSGADAEQAYQKAKDGYRTLMKSSKKQLYRDNWIRVIDRFLAVNNEYPDHPRGASALYMAGKTCRGLYGVSRVKKDARQGVELFDSLAERYPDDTLADDALMLAAEVQEQVFADFPQAYRRYRQIVDRYPDGDMLGAARKKLRELSRYAPAAETAPAPIRKVAPPRARDAELTSVRSWSKPGYTRVVLDLSVAADYTANVLPADPGKQVGPRIYVDLPGVVPAAGVAESTTVGDGLLKRIRTGLPGKARVRVVLDLASFKDYKIFSLENPHRIVVDVAGDGAPELTADRPDVSAIPSATKDGIARVLDQVPGEPPLKLHIPPARTGLGLRRVVVDAGHGGRDPGAIGPSGVLEKDVVLAMAKELARRLEDDLGCEVVLTRNGDVYLPLEERTAIANKLGADLFISIHANASTSRKAYGFETYYLNFSKNDKAAAVAARENGTSIKEVGDLELILFDLMANSKINESSRLAAEIQKSMVDGLSRHYSDIRDLGVRQGPFYVLLGATMPSVLVETGFISNKREESRLTSGKFRKRTVAAIASGVRNYATALKLIAAK